MIKTILYTVGAALICGTAIADVQESRITFTSNGQEVVGTLALPDGDPAPVVLLLHGFTGSRDELKSDFVKTGVFAHSASVLAEAGYASLRIDFIKDYAGPLFVAQGSKDTTVLPENADALIAAHDGPEQLWTAEMDHVFNAFATSETLDRMLAETIAFFKANED